VRRLIINADDFGLTSGVNRAIAEASRSGVLTSATIMANSRAFDEAVMLTQSLPALKTGCHVVLIDGEPISDDLVSLTSQSPTNPDLANNAQRFRSSLKEFAVAAVRKKISADEIQREAEVQIRKIQASGITVTHVDTHKHTHMFPHVLRSVLRAAKACGVHAVRNPFEPLRSWPVGAMLGAPSLWVRAADVATLWMFAASFRKAVQEEDMLTTDGTLGIAATGVLDQKMSTAILNALPEGTWELVCHPGYSDADLQSAGTRLLKSREVELDALTSPETRSLISRRGIDLISYADLRRD
jgi:hopanoid biosynthesis associated protein HpnK